jgi:hypothetical protein
MSIEQKQRIQEARRLQRDGEFNRLIQDKAPLDIYWDEVTLECGHKSRVLPNENTPMAFCGDCARAWIEGAA